MRGPELLTPQAEEEDEEDRDEKPPGGQWIQPAGHQLAVAPQALAAAAMLEHCTSRAFHI